MERKTNLSTYREAQLEITGANDAAYAEDHKLQIEAQLERQAAIKAAKAAHSCNPLPKRSTYFLHPVQRSSKKQKVSGAGAEQHKDSEKACKGANNTPRKVPASTTTASSALSLGHSRSEAKEAVSGGSTDPMLKRLSKREMKFCQARSLHASIFGELVKVPKNSFTAVLCNDQIDDTIINAFIAQLLVRIKASKFPLWIYSTFFLTIMHNKVQSVEKEYFSPTYVYKYSKVKRWLRFHDVDFTTLTGLLFPCHVDGNHWILYIMQPNKKLLTCYNPMCNNQTSSTSFFANSLVRWYHDEIESFKGKDFAASFDVTSWNVEYDTIFPKQSDARSCGIFVLSVMENISRWTFGVDRDPRSYIMPFSASDLRILRQRIAYHIRKGLP